MRRWTSSRTASNLGLVASALVILFVLAAGCRDAPEERDTAGVDLDQLRQQIEQEHEAIEAEYGPPDVQTPPEVREMAEHLQAMLAQIRQLQQGRRATEVVAAAPDTTARATREWHEQMAAAHEVAALLQQDEALAARHRRLMQLHRQLVQHLPAAAAAEPDVAATRNPAGAALYVPYCAACHGRQGEGAADIFPPLVGTSWVTGETDDLIRVVLHGLEGPITVQGETYEGSMPPFGPRLNDEEVAAILTYIRSAWDNEAGPISPAEVSEVREEHAGRIEPWTAGTLDKADTEQSPR